MTSSTRLHAIYCDDEPATERGGFASILGNLIQSKHLPEGFSVQTAARPNTNAQSQPNMVRGWGFLGQKGASRKLVYRMALIIWDLLAHLTWKRFDQGKENYSSVCVFVGADWTSLIRGLIVAKCLGAKRKSVYVVDNIYSLSLPETGFGRSSIDRLVGSLFKRFDHHFAITDGLANALSLRTGLTWSAVDLPYDFEVGTIQCQPDAEVSLDFSIEVPRILVFVGALSPYVTPMLDRLLGLMSSDPNLTEKLELHLLSQRIPEQLLLRHDRHLAAGRLKVFCGMSDADIVSKYQESGVFVCPYSDLQAHQSFVSESFPSKLLKMLQTGIPCVLLAPPHAAVCRTHSVDVPTVHLQDSLAPLLEVIKTLPRRSKCLTEAIKSRHDPASFLRKVCP
jgi:hypothetical protein